MYINTEVRTIILYLVLIPKDVMWWTNLLKFHLKNQLLHTLGGYIVKNIYTHTSLYMHMYARLMIVTIKDMWTGTCGFE